MSPIPDAAPALAPAIVTGAASGIGLGIASRFLAEGHSVLAVDRDESLLAALADASKDVAGGLACLTMDVAEPQAAEQIFDACLERLGPAQILVNNAGFANAKEALQTSDEDWTRYLDVNLGSVFRLSRYAARVMEPGGAVVNIASVFGMVGFRGSSSYSAAKAGVIGLTRQMAADYGRRGIRFNAVAPGIIETPATAERIRTNRWLTRAMIDTAPLGRAGLPADVAEAVLFLASPKASFITGAVLPVDGGWTATRFFPDLTALA